MALEIGWILGFFVARVCMESTKVRKHECQERTNERMNNYSCLSRNKKTLAHKQRCATVKYKHRILNKMKTNLTRLELSGADENFDQRRAVEFQAV